MFKSLMSISQNSERCSLFFVALGVGMLCLSACEPRKQSKRQVVFSGPMMGTEFRITVIHENESDAPLKTAVVAAMTSVNQSMSHYINDSEVSLFNRLEAGKAQALSSDLSQVLRESLQISHLSNGAFDVTLAKAIGAWGFGPAGTISQRPNDETLKELRASVGFDKLVMDDNTLTKTVNGVEINLSAIAKGFAVDKVAIALHSQGVSDYLINIGGELRASGLNLNDQLWRVGIEKPHILGGIEEIVELDGVSIATSGDYRNYVLLEGKQFSHTIDPKTLIPVYHKLALVSVISDRASTSDALATAMMAMGEHQAWAFAQKNKLAAYLIVRGDQEGSYQALITDKFKRYLQ